MRVRVRVRVRVRAKVRVRVRVRVRVTNLAEAPQHREHDALAAVRDDLGDEAAEEQPGDAVLGDGGGQG